jgi:small-conductance mechanosensitive channel
LLATFILFLPKSIIAGVGRRWSSQALGRGAIHPELTQSFCEVRTGGMIRLGAFAGMQQVFNLTAFLTGLDILGFTAGVAPQEVSQNFVAGPLSLLQQPFAVGETLQVAGYTGRASASTMRTPNLIRTMQ